MSEGVPTLTPAVLIIGGGPAGLRAARELAQRLGDDVLVLEREAQAGGIPRHSDHPGYGMRDMGRFISGPAYARRLVRQAEAAGAQIRTNAMVTNWVGDLAVEATTPQGRIRVEAGAVILATGARERPRAARMIPGDRSKGVYTTGNLQNLVHLNGQKVGKRAVVVGAELVSWSAALTLQYVGCRTVLMTTEYPRADSYFFFSLPGRILFRTRVATRTRVVSIIGRPTVEAVEIENLDTGKRRTIACDTVILTGDWIPDNELARATGIAIDPGTLGPVVDAALRTGRAGIFAIGNMLHPVDTADIAALDGAHVVDSILAWLGGGAAPAEHVRLTAEKPLRWVSPQVLRAGDPSPARRRLLLWTDRFVAFPTVVLRQDGVVVARKRLWWPAAPGRVFRVPSSILRKVNLGDDLSIGLERSA